MKRLPCILPVLVAVSTLLIAGLSHSAEPNKEQVLTNEELKKAAVKVRAKHRGDRNTMWNALADLVKPGMTVAQMKVVLPPSKHQPGIVLWNGQTFYARYSVDDRFEVVAGGYSRHIRDKIFEEVLSARPVIEPLDPRHIWKRH